jgi:AcrR family transcriptional regulator
MSTARVEASDALLDAAEKLLVEVGYASITTRRLAERAGVNHGLVHYYFGSMDELLLRVVDRFTDRLIARQQEMYDAPVPFIEKWRSAMQFMDEDAESGYQKMWFEVQAMAWNQPAIRARLQDVHKRWLGVVRPAFEVGLTELGIDQRQYPTEAVVSLVITFNQGVMLERLLAMDSGQAALLQMIDRMIERLWKEKKGARKRA